MTRNTLNDPKVRYEVGDGGAPEEEGKQLVLLEEEYQEGARALQELGYNGDVFDLELPRAKKRVFAPDDESNTEALIKDGVVNRAGKLCENGVNIINCGVMLEANRRLNEKKKEATEKAIQNKTLEKRPEIEIALNHWQNWKRKANQLDKNNKFNLLKIKAVSIVKVLLPRIDPTKKPADYVNKGPCVDWLMSLDGETTWETELEAVRKQFHGDPISDLQSQYFRQSLNQKTYIYAR